jgi:hypothetical protein
MKNCYKFPGFPVDNAKTKRRKRKQEKKGGVRGTVGSLRKKNNKYI